MSDYIKDGVYYAIDATNKELRRMPYALEVKHTGDSPFVEDMPAGVFQMHLVR